MSRRGWRVRVPAAAGLLLAWSAIAGGPAGAATGVPYTDPSATGYLGLCNQAGQQITSGSVGTVPFAWRAVSSVPAPSPYDNTGRTAVLVAYQPQQELPPGDWSGEQLTASSRYSNPTNPMAAATDGDGSLEGFLQDYPTKWDGFVELRMYLGTDDEPSYQEKYPVLDIKVTGSTWHAVGGGAVDCSSGTAESIESILLPPSTTTTAPTAANQPAAASTSAGGSSGGSGGSATTPTSGPTTGASGAGSTATGSKVSGSGDHGHGSSDAGGATAATTSTSSTPVGLIAGLVTAAVVLLVAAWLLVARRRRSGRSGPGSGPAPATGTGRGAGPQTGTGPAPATDTGRGAGPHTDAGDEPASDHDLAMRQKAATKGE